ncbi:hypothetical protein PVAND_017751, partial [Polypedilum vanderplanki]
SKNSNADSNLNSNSNVDNSRSGSPINQEVNSANVKIKPIVLKTFLKISGRNVQVICNNQKDKTIVIEKLRLQEFKFHTFTEEINKNMTVLLKGFYLDKVENVKQLITLAGLEVKTLRIFTKFDDSATYAISMEKSHSIGELNNRFRIIDSIIVKWEPFDRSKKRPTQCFKCKKFGHSSIIVIINENV